MLRRITSLSCMRRGSGPGASLTIAIAMVILLGNLFSPMMANANANVIANDARLDQLQAEQLQPLQPLSSETPTETTVPPASETPTDTPTETATVTETPAVTTTETPTSPQSLSNIKVTTYWCPDTVLVATAPDGQAIKPDCNLPGPSVDVVLTSTTNPAFTQTQSTLDATAGGQVFFTDLPADAYSLDFNAPVSDQGIFCETYGNQGNTKPYARYAFVQQGISVDNNGDVINTNCDWFGVQAPGSSVTFYKWDCPAGTMSGQAKTYYETECATEKAGVPFEITDTTGTRQTTSDNNGRQIDGLQGEFTIKEIVPPNYENPAIFCQLLNDAQSTDYSSTSPEVKLPENTTDSYQCWFYNIPGQGMGPTNVGSGDVQVHKFACSMAAPANADYNWYFMNCFTPQNGVTFVLDTPNVPIQTNTGDSINGAVMMGGVDAGTYPLTETAPPANFQTGAVFCATVPIGQTPTAGDFQPQSVNANAITATVTADSLFYCEWFNVPTTTTGTSVTFYKWECPEGTALNQPMSYYSGECATEQAGIPFEVTDTVGTQQTTSDTNGRQIDGLQGQFTITEIVPAGYLNPPIFCQLLNDAQATDYTSTSPSVTLPPSSTDSYQCWFYNIPDDGTSVTIYKWECPPGTLTGQTSSYYSAECATEQPGVPFEVTDTVGTQQTTSDNNGRQIDGLVGQFTITEIMPPGFGNPAIFCQLLNGQGSDYSATSPSVTLPPSADDDYQCWFYNIPEMPNTVTIYKWECPQGEPADTTSLWFQTNCTTPKNGVEFTLTDSMGPRSMTTANGMVQWTDVTSGAVQVKETVPPGYSPNPYVYCQVQNLVTNEVVPPTINGVWNTTIDHGGIKVTCHWYNWYLGPGEITVYKWTCPEGYDRHAWGADPMTDCTEATNGVTFKLDQPDPEIDLMSNTGDSVNGAVYFGGLTPGDYVLSELVSPGSMMDVFVWQCYGLNTSSVQNPPLSVGQDFSFKIAGGDKIVCHWFNVPYPQYGWVVVSKFNCTTETYVSDVYCYTNQTGQEFNLQKWDGANWVTVSSGTTDVSGKVTFNNLNAGDYKLVEPNKQACLMKSSNITAGGNIGVNQGEGTTVYVYNCQTPPPPQTGKTPTKYPNTGVAPAADQGEQRTPAIELAGLLALARLHLNRRRLLKGATVLAAGSATAWSFGQAQELVPLDSTPAPGTPDAAALGCATPEASTPMADGTPTASSTPMIDPCNRGAIPMQIRVPKIEVDAAIEYLEIIDGEMQAPSGATDVTWYKETSRLGEVGNGIYAGHLNYWGVPEGVFFRLESLAEGDIIEIDGDDQQTYLFQVQWMQNFPSDEEPPAEALGFTEEPVITLITCGGEWVPDRSEYDHRTLVRAVLWEP